MKMSKRHSHYSRRKLLGTTQQVVVGNSITAGKLVVEKEIMSRDGILRKFNSI